jgi:hypothetical protein
MVMGRWQNWRRPSLAVLLLALVILGACHDQPSAPVTHDPYLVDMSNFARFEFWCLPALFCLEPGDVRYMVITRATPCYAVQLTHVSQRTCAQSESLLTYSSQPRDLTPAEVDLVLTTFREVEFKRAEPDSCRLWGYFWNCFARWDEHLCGELCTVDHLSIPMVNRLFALVDSLDVDTGPPLPNRPLHPTGTARPPKRN